MKIEGDRLWQSNKLRSLTVLRHEDTRHKTLFTKKVRPRHNSNIMPHLTHAYHDPHGVVTTQMTRNSLRIELVTKSIICERDYKEKVILLTGVV